MRTAVTCLAWQMMTVAGECGHSDMLRYVHDVPGDLCGVRVLAGLNGMWIC